MTKIRHRGIFSSRALVLCIFAYFYTVVVVVIVVVVNRIVVILVEICKTNGFYKTQYLMSRYPLANC